MPNQLLVEIAEEYGLATDREILSRLPHLETREINQIYEELVASLRINNDESSRLLPSSFNFFVSAAMRGDRFCIHPGCRLKKLPIIERYAALYGDHMLLPVRMSDDSKSNRRTSIEALLRTISSIRPLVDAELIIPISTGICVCRKCRPLIDKEVESVAQTGRYVSSKYIDEFEINYLWDRRKRLHVFILDGPDELIGNASRVQTFRVMPDWFKGSAKPAARRLTREEVVCSGFVERLFNSSAFDIFSQAALAKENGCSYLSDSETEAAFFDEPDLGFDADYSRSDFAEALAHEVPMFAELPTNAILDLRREYPDAFRAYRSALSEAVSQQAELIAAGKLSVREFYRDTIEPRVNELRSLDSSSRIAAMKVAGLSAAIPTVSLLFGLLDHKLPETIAELAKLVGASGLAKSIVDPIMDSTKNKAKVKSDPYFFLLKMDKAWKRARETCR